VGGDGALNRAINGVLQEDPDFRKRITFGIIPNGHGNDYAKFWGLDQDEPEQAVETLIKRRVRQVDVGLLRYHVEKDEEDLVRERYFLNCVNVGLVANIMSLRHKTYRFWGLSSLSYLSSMMLLIFHRMENHMRLTINHETIDHSLMTVCVGNSHGYGQTPNAVPYNGMLDITTVSHPAISQLFAGMYMLFTGKFLANRHVRPYRTRGKVVFHEIGRAKVSHDGQVMNECKAPLEISVKQEWISVIIPS